MPQAVGIVAVLTTGGDHQQAEAQYVGEAVLDPIRRARIVDAGGEALGDAEALLDLTQRQQTAIAGEGPPSKRGMIGLPATGDTPGRDGVTSVVAGMESGNGGV